MNSDALFDLIKLTDELLYGRSLCPSCLSDSGNNVKCVSKDDDLSWHCKACDFNVTGADVKLRVPTWVFESSMLIVTEGELLDG